MYFHESEAIAREHTGLQRVVEQIDGHLATIFNPAPLRPADFASVLSCDTNQVVSIFGLLAQREVLLAEGMVECERCHNLMPASAYDEAMADEDDFECSGCSRPYRRRAPRTTIYRMTAETLARPRPAVAPADIETALGELGRSPFVFRRLGQIWVLKFEGEMKLMQDARGLFYVARLLAEPDRDVWCAHLLAAAVGIDPRITLGSSGPASDNPTMRKCKETLDDLREELDTAMAGDDEGRIARIESDMRQITKEIARSMGLGGKIRGNTDVDKVRKSVSMAVSRAVDSIRDEHQVLGKHLLSFISSGTIFRYSPDRRIDWLT